MFIGRSSLDGNSRILWEKQGEFVLIVKKSILWGKVETLNVLFLLLFRNCFFFLASVKFCVGG